MSGNHSKHHYPRLAKTVLLLLAVLLATGCATKIKVNMLKPAQYHQASLTKAVAVLPFSGPSGSEFAAEIEGILGSINIDDKAYFTLVDRAAIDKTLSEQKLSQSGLIDSRTAARIGRWLGRRAFTPARSRWPQPRTAPIRRSVPNASSGRSKKTTKEINTREIASVTGITP
jgi:hypothetical protein